MPSESIQDDIFPLLKLKPMLGRAEDASLGCAIALSKDKKDFALLIDHKMPGKKVRDKLKTELDDKFDKGMIRFGNVVIDKANDPGTVKFSLNKAAPGGTIPLLVKLIKKAGYQGVSLNEDPALEKDGPDAPAAEEAPAARAAPGIPEPPPPPPPVPPPPPGAPPTPSADAKVLLGAFIKRIGAITDPAQRESLAALARVAQSKLVTGAPIKAELMALKSGLDVASANAPAGVVDGPKATDGPVVALAKSSTLWRGTRAQMRGKLEKLKSAILDAYDDAPEVKAAVQQNFGALDRIFEMLDGRLDAVLDDAINAKDPNDRLEFIAESRSIIDQYTQMVSSDPLIGQLDANPFGIDMKFKDTLDKVLPALSGLSRTLH